MRALKKKADTYGGSAGSKTATKPTVVLKVIPQEKAIELIKAGNSEGLQEMIDQAGEDTAFLNLCHSKTGRHPLAVAAEEGRQMETDILIIAKVEIDKRDQHGMTAALYAAKNGEPDILKILVSAGADVTAIHEATNEDMLFLAAKHRHINVVQLLIEMERPAETVNYRHETPLWNAVKMEQYDLAKLLLKQKGVNINVVLPGGNSLLLSAAFTGHNFTQIDFLLENGANIAWQNDNGVNAFMLCARHGHDVLLQKLIAFCAAREEDLAQARSLAAQYGGLPTEYTKLPNTQDIDYQSLINAQDSGLKTALMYAALHSQPACLQLLLEHPSIDPYLQDRWGYTALFFALRVSFSAPLPPSLHSLHSSTAAAAETETSTATSDSQFLTVMQQKMLRVLDLLLAHDPESQHFLLLDNGYHNALAHACIKQNLTFAQRLIQKGCDWNVRNIDEKLPVDLLHSKEHQKRLLEMIQNYEETKDKHDDSQEERKQFKSSILKEKPKWLRTLNRELYSSKQTKK